MSDKQKEEKPKEKINEEEQVLINPETKPRKTPENP